MTPPPADPVRELLDANRELCEQANDPLEIAAALEDSGLATDGAARYRHADVFGLAAELHARVPHRPPVREPLPAAPPRRALPAAALRAAAVHLLPLAALSAVGGTAGGALAVAAGAGAGALAALRGDGPSGAVRPALGYGAGAGLLLALLAAAAPGTATAAAIGGATAGWGAALLRRFGRRQTAAATLGEFRSRLRPALPLAVLAQLAATAATGWLGTGGQSATEWAALLALGVLWLLAAAVRDAGHPGAAATAVLTAATGSAALTLPAPAHWLGAPPPGGLLAATLGPVLLLAGCAWPLSTRAGAYR